MWHVYYTNFEKIAQNGLFDFCSSVNKSDFHILVFSYQSSSKNVGKGWWNILAGLPDDW